MQEPTIELSRLDLELFARQLIDDADAHSGAPHTIAQLRGQIPLDLLAAQCTNAFEERRDANLRPAFGEQHTPGANPVAGDYLVHGHLVGALITAGRGHDEPLANCPEAQ